MWQFLNFTARDTWTLDALSRMSPDRALRFFAASERDFYAAFHLNEGGALQASVVRYVNSDGADYRNLEALNVEMGETQPDPWNNRSIRKAKPGDLIRGELGREWGNYDVMDLNRDALWPLLAESFDVFDEAFGLRAAGDPAPRKLRAIQFLRLLPKTVLSDKFELVSTRTGSLPLMQRKDPATR